MRAFALLLALPVWGASLVIDCGSPSDAYYSPASASWIIPQALLPPGTSDATLRFGAAFSYHIPVLPGRYTVTLRFVEPAVPGSGLALLPQRVFTVAVNGVPVPVGGVSQATVEVDAPSGYIDADFRAQVRTAIVSSIEIAPVAAPPAGPFGLHCYEATYDGQSVTLPVMPAGDVFVIWGGDWGNAGGIEQARLLSGKTFSFSPNVHQGAAIKLCGVW